MNQYLNEIDTSYVHGRHEYFMTFGKYRLSVYQVGELKLGKLPVEFLEDESLCDADNIVEAFKMLQECKTEREMAPIKRYMKQLIKEANKNPHKAWKYSFEPIKWEKQWDQEN
jgi:hypothetical protein